MSQQFHIGQKVRLTFPMERLSDYEWFTAIKNVPKHRLTSEGVVIKAWLRMGEVRYTVRLESEVLGERDWSTDGSLIKPC